METNVVFVMEIAGQDVVDQSAQKGDVGAGPIGRGLFARTYPATEGSGVGCRVRAEHGRRLHPL